jgi:hypothetical protein
MKCSVAQTQMLELERPDRPTPPLRAHLARCSACREWFHALLQMERNVPLLPVPPSTGREQFLRHVLTGEPLPGRNGTTAPPVAGRTGAVRRERGMQKTALATGLAAGLVLFAVGLLAIQSPQEVRGDHTSDPFIKKLLDRDLKLASAATARERLQELAGLADDLRVETEMLARLSANEELERLAGLYQRVMRNGIARNAGKVPAADHEGLRDVAFRLGEASRAAELTAAAHPNSSGPLREIATAAREAEDTVRKLLPKEEGQP